MIARELEQDLATVIQLLQDDQVTLYAPVDDLLARPATIDLTVDVPVPPAIAAETETAAEAVRAAPASQAWGVAIDAAMRLVGCGRARSGASPLRGQSARDGQPM